MKAIKNKETGKWSIEDMTEEQIDLMRECVCVIREHLYYDPQQDCYRVESKDVKGMYEKDEVAALKSITL